MSQQTISEKLTKLLVAHFGLKIDDINRDSDLRGDLSLDQVDIADLISLIEKEWAIDLNNQEDLSHLHTFDDLVNLVEENSNEF